MEFKVITARYRKKRSSHCPARHLKDDGDGGATNHNDAALSERNKYMHYGTELIEGTYKVIASAADGLLSARAATTADESDW